MPSFLHYERLVIGYHGCDRSIGERVLLDGERLRPSTNDFDWLGSGVYFWEHGPERALRWAEAAQERGKIAEPFVLGAFIDIEKYAPERAFQTVRGVFTEGGPAFQGSMIQSKTHVQVAVRNLECVLGYFRPAK